MEKIDETFIARYLDGATSEQESKALETWTQAHPENKKKFETIKTLWVKSRQTQANPDLVFDKKAAWKKVQSQVNKPVRRVRLNYWMPRVAAVFILGLFTILIYNRLQSTPDQHTFTATPHDKTLTLPDGSVVLLSEGSLVTYFDDFQTNRTLTFSGSGFFEVVKAPESPFVINTGDLMVRVVGTAFNIINDKTSCTVDVESGIVAVSDQKKENLFQLTKNQSIEYHTSTQQFGPVVASEQNQRFWKTGVLEFTSTPLAKVLLTLEKAYGVQFKDATPGDKPCLFSGRFNKAPIGDVLDQLELSLGLEISKGDTLNILSSKCTQ